MPEIINADLKIKYLRYIANNIQSSVPNIRTGTQKRILELLVDDGYVDNLCCPTEKGFKFLTDNKLNYLTSLSQDAFGVNLQNFYSDSHPRIDKLKLILENRPNPNHEIDHHPVSVESLVLRSSFIGSCENLYNKDVGFIGDYDSTNVALNYLFKVKSSTIFDIDTQLLDFFTSTASQYKYKIQALQYDISQYNKENTLYKEKFDIIVTDPPYTVKGMISFLKFAIDCLKSQGKGYVAIPFHENIDWTERILFESQKFIIGNNCSIVDVVKSFHQYPTTDGMKSSLLVFRKDSHIKKANLEKYYTYNKNINKPIEE